jgi:hypothetical protein
VPKAVPAWRVRTAAGVFLLAWLAAAVTAVLVASGLWTVPRALPARLGSPAAVADLTSGRMPWRNSAAAVLTTGGASLRGASGESLAAEVEWGTGEYRRLPERLYSCALPRFEPGRDSVLSPDGKLLSIADMVLDLQTGSYDCDNEGSPWFERDNAAQAWSLDGSWIAMLTRGDPTGTFEDRLDLFGLRPYRSREVHRLPAGTSLPGWVAAFSPDSRSLAYQDGDVIRVQSPVGGRTATVPVPAGARLAGKGAWTRDGRGLLVVSAERCSCGAYPIRWTVRTIAVADGRVTGPNYQVDGAYAVRVMGWLPSGRPAAAEYVPAADAASTTLTGVEPAFAPGAVRAVRVRELSPDGAHRTLTEAAVESLDVAEGALGMTVGSGGYRRRVAVLAGAAGVLVAAPVAGWRRRRRRPWTP